jgi:YHS domain-containing protein
MLQDTLQARAGLTYVYNGKKYYLCCGGCLAGFQGDAAIHSHATDPIDGKSVDKADAPAYGYKGHAYYFSSASNLAQFAKDPEKFSGAISASRPGS